MKYDIIVELKDETEDTQEYSSDNLPYVNNGFLYIYKGKKTISINADTISYYEYHEQE
jgi:hypothetical protein